MKPAPDPQCSEPAPNRGFPCQEELDEQMHIIEQRLPGKNGIIENSFPNNTPLEKKKYTKSTSSISDDDHESGVSTSNPVSSSNQTLLTGHLVSKSRDRGTPCGNSTRSSSNLQSSIPTATKIVVAETPSPHQNASSLNSQSASASTLSTNSRSQSHSQSRSSATKQLKISHLRPNKTSPSGNSNDIRGLISKKSKAQSSSTHRKKGSTPTKDTKHSIQVVDRGSSAIISRKRPRHGDSNRHNEKPKSHEAVSQSPQLHNDTNSNNVSSEITSFSRDRLHSRGGNASNASPSLTSTKTNPNKKSKKDRGSIFNYFGGKNKNAGLSSSTKSNRNSLDKYITKRKESNSIHENSLSNFPSTRSNISTMSQGDLSEVDRLKHELEYLSKKCKNQQDEINSIRNNTTIETMTLRKVLERKEDEIKEMQQKADQLTNKSVKAVTIIESLMIEKKSRDALERKQRLTSNDARLGKFVYTRSGLHSGKSWEHGHTKKAIEQKKAELRRKKEELEIRKKRMDEAVQLKESKLAELGDFKHESKISLEVEIVEAVEAHYFKLSRLEEKIAEVGEEEKALHKERDIHVRELKKIESEEMSRFKHKGKLNNRYVLLNLLGKGGFSEVWRAFDLECLREVAVKIHQLDTRWPESKKENFTKHVSREYEIHRDVRHPRIVSLYDVFEIDNDSFATVLECCKGTDLDTLLKEKKVLPERKARAILLQILNGMQYLSSASEDGSRQGIIHYDLKPANILFDEFGDAKITDFGLSKIVDPNEQGDSMELTSQGAGTYWYLPPECFIVTGGVRISNKVDVWSIGVMFYQMLFGMKPFGDGESQEKVLLNNTMLKAKVVKIPSQPQISIGCKDFLQSCLTYDQVYRPSIAQLCQHSYLLQKDISLDSKALDNK